MRTLYPELTDDEYVRTITPLRRRSARRPADAPSALPATTDVAFGPAAEPSSFWNVCAYVARETWEATWSPDRAPGVRDTETFADVQVHRLALDVFNLAIRPLADGLRAFVAAGGDSYEAYCAALLEDGLAAFAAANPVLWARLQRRLQAKIAALGETLDRLHADRPAIERAMGIPAGAAVTAVDCSGDTHGGGRAVALIGFDGGHRLVYKPRPVDCEAAWGRLTARLRDRHDLDVRGLTVLDRDRYGYVKFVAAAEAAPPPFGQVGQLAAVLYLLRARDMHFSNIQATADGPVAIDLETLLHPPRQKSTGLLETARSAYRILGESVYGTGILPLVVTKPGATGSVDVGFAGGGEIQGRSPFRRFRVEHEFRTDLRVVWDAGVQAPAPPPTVGDEPAREIRRRCAEMVAGFELAYRRLQADAEAFGAAVHGHFAGCRLRYVHNPTIRYDQTLRSLTATEAAADETLADGLLKRVAIASPACAPELVESECAQLWATDVPYFLVRSDGRDLLRADGTTIAADAFAAAPLQDFDKRLAGASEADLQRQVALIEMAFNAKLPDPHAMGEVVALQRGAGTPAAEDEDEPRLRALATDLADRLTDAMVEDRYAHLPRTWIGPVASAQHQHPWSPGVLGYDLYTGRSGPALALAALGRSLGTARHRDAAAAVFEPVATILNDRTFETRSVVQAGIGAYNGFAGTVWALAAAGRLLDRPDFLRAVDAAAPFLDASADGPGYFDAITGGAGAELVLLELGLGGEALHARVDASCRTALGHRLADHQEHSGLAHGVAGLLRYAARAHRATGSPAARGLYEHAHAALQRRFRLQDGRGHRTNATGAENVSDSWCNGGAGLLIALAEGAAAGLGDPAELDGLVDRLRHGKVSRNLTLCHGILGLRETTAAVHRRLGGHAAVEALDRDLLAHLDAEVIAAGALDAGSRYCKSPSLMAGRAGVVLHLRNRLDPTGPVISPLTLDLEVAA